MTLIPILITIFIAAVLVFVIKRSSLDEFWKILLYAVIALFVVVWFLNKLRGSSVDLSI